MNNKSLQIVNLNVRVPHKIVAYAFVQTLTEVKTAMRAAALSIRYIYNEPLEKKSVLLSRYLFHFKI